MYQMPLKKVEILDIRPLKKSDHFTFGPLKGWNTSHLTLQKSAPLKKCSVSSHSSREQSFLADNKTVNIGSEFNRRDLAAIDKLSKTISQSSQNSSFGIIYSTPWLSELPADSRGSTKEKIGVSVK
jgi:hypothetical protein